MSTQLKRSIIGLLTTSEESVDVGSVKEVELAFFSTSNFVSVKDLGAGESRPLIVPSLSPRRDQKDESALRFTDSNTASSNFEYTSWRSFRMRRSSIAVVRVSLLARTEKQRRVGKTCNRESLTFVNTSFASCRKRPHTCSASGPSSCCRYCSRNRKSVASDLQRVSTRMHIGEVEHTDWD